MGTSLVRLARPAVRGAGQLPVLLDLGRDRDELDQLVDDGEGALLLLLLADQVAKLGLLVGPALDLGLDRLLRVEGDARGLDDLSMLEAAPAGGQLLAELEEDPGRLLVLDDPLAAGVEVAGVRRADLLRPLRRGRLLLLRCHRLLVLAGRVDDRRQGRGDRLRDDGVLEVRAEDREDVGPPLRLVAVLDGAGALVGRDQVVDLVDDELLPLGLGFADEREPEVARAEVADRLRGRAELVQEPPVGVSGERVLLELGAFEGLPVRVRGGGPGGRVVRVVHRSSPCALCIGDRS